MPSDCFMTVTFVLDRLWQIRRCRTVYQDTWVYYCCLSVCFFQLPFFLGRITFQTCWSGSWRICPTVNPCWLKEHATINFQTLTIRMLGFSATMLLVDTWPSTVTAFLFNAYLFIQTALSYHFSTTLLFITIIFFMYYVNHVCASLLCSFLIQEFYVQDLGSGALPFSSLLFHNMIVGICPTLVQECSLTWYKQVRYQLSPDWHNLLGDAIVYSWPEQCLQCFRFGLSGPFRIIYGTYCPFVCFYGEIEHRIDLCKLVCSLYCKELSRADQMIMPLFVHSVM